MTNYLQIYKEHTVLTERMRRALGGTEVRLGVKDFRKKQDPEKSPYHDERLDDDFWDKEDRDDI